jgi:AraC family transcriptional regulator, arabinose operon regulatory protein
VPKTEVQFLFGQYVPRCTHQVDKQFDYCVLQYLDGGAVDLRIDDSAFHMEGRWFWSSYPGPRISFHAAGSHRNWVHRYLAFKGPVVERWRKAGLFPVPPQAIEREPELDRTFARSFDELLILSRRTDRWGYARALLALEMILTELAEARTRLTETPGWLAAAIARMQTLGAAADFEELAAEVGMPSRTFRRRFHTMLGCSPHRYLIRSRIGHAKEMLGGTELPIKSISEQLGYRDVSFFTRQFRMITGVAPAAYRRSREA